MKFAAYAAAFPELALEWERRMWGDLPEGWADGLPTFLPRPARWPPGAHPERY